MCFFLLASWTQAKESGMAGDQPVAGRLFHRAEGSSQGSVAQFLRSAADLTDQVMVVMPGDLINQLSAAHVRCAGEVIIRQELEGAVHSRFGDSGQGLERPFVYLMGSQMSAIMVEDMQDGHALRGEAKASFSK